ncbi:putative F-box domain-containing protein [Helianthus debilis subsp. tardiflorus]
MEGCVLPENLIFEVLSRLPVKTIARCKCVCKKWRDLVSDTYFVHLHLSRSPPCLMFHLYLPIVNPILELVEVEHEADYHRLTVNHVKTLNLHLCAFNARYRIIQVGSVNGLICLCHTFDATYVINPVLEEYMILPQPPRLRNITLLGHGFGVSMAGEYKVIRILGRSISQLPIEVSVEIQVYTLGTDQWRSLGPTPFNIRHPGEVGGVFVNSHVYWVIYGQIFDFDLDSETFELIPSPLGEPGYDTESKQMLGVLKGSCLSLFSWTSLGFTVWVMKGESWYKAIAMNEENMDPVLKSLEWKPVYLIDGSDGTSILIFWPQGTESLEAYCLDTNKILDLNLPGNFWTVMHTYRPSFVKLQDFGSERVHSLYGNDTAFVKDRYKSSLMFERM